MKYELTLTDDLNNRALLLAETRDIEALPAEAFARAFGLLMNWSNWNEGEKDRIRILVVDRDYSDKRKKDYSFGIFDMVSLSPTYNNNPVPRTLAEFYNLPSAIISRAIVGGINFGGIDDSGVAEYTVNT